VLCGSVEVHHCVSEELLATWLIAGFLPLLLFNLKDPEIHLSETSVDFYQIT
jgi:hypothetical protein